MGTVVVSHGSSIEKGEPPGVDGIWHLELTYDEQEMAGLKVVRERLLNLP